MCSMQCMLTKDTETTTVETLQEKALNGFEVRIINDYANERLELTKTLDQALAYIKAYSMHHEDLVAFNPVYWFNSC